MSRIISILATTLLAISLPAEAAIQNISVDGRASSRVLWGAVAAVRMNYGVGIGVSVNQKSREEAVRLAVSECNEDGVVGCALIQVFQVGCGFIAKAMSKDGSQHGFAASSTVDGVNKICRDQNVVCGAIKGGCNRQ